MEFFGNSTYMKAMEKVFCNAGHSFSKLVSTFGSDVSVLSANGVATFLLFRSKAQDVLKITENTTDLDMAHVAKMIIRECFESLPDATDLILYFLAKLFLKPNQLNTALMIGNIITSVVTNIPTTLQNTMRTSL